MFVLVPISVQTPPRMVAYESGMKSLDGAMPVRFDRSLTTGRNIATMGVLFRNADRLAHGIIKRSCAAVTFLGRPRSGRVTRLIAPVRERPATTT